MQRLVLMLKSTDNQSFQSTSRKSYGSCDTPARYESFAELSLPKTEKSIRRWFEWRHIVTLLAFFGFFAVYASRISLSIALVAMLNQTSLRLSREEFYKEKNLSSVQNSCRETDDVTVPQTKDGPYVWDEELQSLILSAFYYGYIMTQLPGGILASWIGGKWVFGCSIMGTVLLSLLTPTAAELGPSYLIILRVLQGLSEGAVWPAYQFFFSKWSPLSERSQLPAFASAGTYLGTLCAFMVSGIIADSDFLGGWPTIFYVFGTFGCVWFIFWAIFTSSSPETHKWISDDEKNFILESTDKENELRLKHIPWSSIAKSLPVWAVFISHFTLDWNLYVLTTGLPIYMHDVLGFDIKMNGVASALPYLCQGIVQILCSKFADLMRTRFSTTTVRKIFDCLGHFLPAVFLIAVSYVGCSKQTAVAFLILSVGLSGLNGVGCLINFLDLAPQASGVLFGISNTLATTPGIVGPLVTGILIKGVQGQDLFDAWRNVFFIAAAFYTFSAIFYLIFGKGEVQPWAKSKSAVCSETLRA